MAALELQNLSDEQLARASLLDPELFSVLAERCRKGLFLFVHRRLRQDQEQAEDIVQEALLRAFLNLNRFDPSRKWKTWLYRIAINCARNFARKPRFESLDFFADNFITGNSPEIATEIQLKKEKLRRAFSCLDPEEMSILKYYAAGRRPEEIGLELGLSGAAVKSRLRRAKINLLLNLKVDRED